MAVLLHRLGRSAYRHRKLVLGIWLVVLAALIWCAGVFGSKLYDRFTVPGTGVAARAGHARQDAARSLRCGRPDRLHRTRGPPHHRGPLHRGHS